MKKELESHLEKQAIYDSGCEAGLDYAKRMATNVTLRQFYAAKAMQALLGKLTETPYMHEGVSHSVRPLPEFIAEVAFTYADAMLKAEE